MALDQQELYFSIPSNSANTVSLQVIPLSFEVFDTKFALVYRLQKYQRNTHTMCRLYREHQVRLRVRLGMHLSRTSYTD
jgi:hypothetical protein